MNKLKLYELIGLVSFVLSHILLIIAFLPKEEVFNEFIPAPNDSMEGIEVLILSWLLGCVGAIINIKIAKRFDFKKWHFVVFVISASIWIIPLFLFITPALSFLLLPVYFVISIYMYVFLLIKKLKK